MKTHEFVVPLAGLKVGSRLFTAARHKTEGPGEWLEKIEDGRKWISFPPDIIQRTLIEWEVIAIARVAIEGKFESLGNVPDPVALLRHVATHIGEEKAQLPDGPFGWHWNYTAPTFASYEEALAYANGDAGEED